jgi:hypothetical protein
MPSYSKSDVLLVHYPFTDLSATQVRPAIVVQAPHASPDLIIVPLTSKTAGLRTGEFVLLVWQVAPLGQTALAMQAPAAGSLPLAQFGPGPAHGTEMPDQGRKPPASGVGSDGRTCLVKVKTADLASGQPGEQLLCEKSERRSRSTTPASIDRPPSSPQPGTWTVAGAAIRP